MIDLKRRSRLSLKADSGGLRTDESFVDFAVTDSVPVFQHVCNLIYNVLKLNRNSNKMGASNQPTALLSEYNI